MAAVTPAAAGRITRGIPSACASRQPWTGPEPPKAMRVSARGSRPRSIETTRVASSMLVVTIAWIPQAASGSANLIGDLEYRGQGLNKSSGTYYGFVDSGTAAAGNTTDVTVAPPYAWRP